MLETIVVISHNPPHPASTLQLPEACERTWDAVVLGGGPAGAAAARTLASNGHSVLLVDKNEFPRPKVCGCCLSGSALDALEQLGLGGLPEQLGALPLHEIRLFMGARRGAIRLPASKVVSRDAFDCAMIAAAIEAGAEFISSTTARGTFIDAGGETRSVRVESHCKMGVLRGKVVLAATGLNHNAFLDSHPALQLDIDKASRMGLGTSTTGSAGFQPAGRRDGGAPSGGGWLNAPRLGSVQAPGAYAPHTVFMASSGKGYVGLVSLEDGRINIAAALDPAFIRESGGPAKTIDAFLSNAGLPPLENAGEIRWHGTPLLTRRRKRVAAERLFLIGDAAGYVEPFTGEGIAWALMSGFLAAQIAGHGIGQWHAQLEEAWIGAHRQSIQNRQRPCQAISKVLRSPILSAAAVTIFTTVPLLSRPLLRFLHSPLSAPSRKGACTKPSRKGACTEPSRGAR